MSAIAASIALAPFENLSGDPSQDVLALGFVEDVASALSRFGAIEVVYPRAFAAAVPGRTGDDPTANASNLLRGSVRRAGDVIRIAVQLLDTHTGRQLWADRHDVTADTLFTVQDQIAEQVASAMKIGVDRSRLRAAQRAPLSSLVARWIPALPDLHRALMSTRMRVADVGSGAGWSTLAMANAFPEAEVVGFDADPASVHDAQRNAAAHGVDVRFAIRDAAAVAEDGPFDLVLEALHDMARPEEALRAIREALAPGGSVLVADEKVGDHFHAPADDLERLMYGWSIVHCLPVAMAEQPTAAIGTVIRAATVQALATAAGFPRVEVVPVDGGFFRLYRLRAE